MHIDIGEGGNKRFWKKYLPWYLTVSYKKVYCARPGGLHGPKCRGSGRLDKENGEKVWNQEEIMYAFYSEIWCEWL